MLSKFESIGLKDLDGLKLLNRRDIKFTFGANLLKGVLLEMLKDYYCLEIEGLRCNSYKTLYFDTVDLSLYKKHHNGNLNRQKVRFREYSDSKLCYLEVKQKNNKGRTIKERIKTTSIDSNFKPSELEFLSRELNFDPSLLSPTVLVKYKRMTFVDKAFTERVTIDIDIAFRNDVLEKEMHNLVIAEVKQDKKNKSAFLDVMRKHRIKQNSISKYCFAIAATSGKVKQNNFKEKILSLKNILHYDSSASHY